ncbi:MULTISPECIES: ABC transporter substrate-binding protein [unclassified Methanoregula]|uniref:ABC transporter substrate-binding protein n=1 Tax=unclassified Methanoregula TaxID=2649730 RepID=UPI0009D41620|nr:MULTISPECIES: cobalamin-binding protein [unclassified Methanoregula]OPX64399.1 MAG: Cobalamin-binding protein precursor [Methanoregula sp. PtaB.Bin085]OPY34931.1 MAG: Cobalamin-binding protein precursor [Methanoregula sp. PtaU1.Bin006]
MKPTTTRVPCHSAVILILALALCLNILPVSAVTVTDDSGANVTLAAPPQRIVSLAPSNTEILAALGLLDRVVGVTDVCDYPPAVKTIPRIGGYSAISTEKVSAAHPDLVLASDITPKETVRRLRALGLTVMVVSPHNIDQVIEDIRRIGTVTGEESTADTLAANLSARLAVIAPANPATRRPTVAHVVWNKPLYVSGNDTLQDDIIAHAGGTNAFSNVDGWGTVSLEQFLMKNPDIVIVSGGGGMDNAIRDVILEDFMTSPQYASLSAVKNHRVYAVNADAISRAGPRIVDAAEQVAADIRAMEMADKTSREIPAPAARSPGFCAGSIVLIIGIMVVLREAGA